MNIKNRLSHLAQISSRDRGLGKTTMLAKMTKEMGGIFLTHTTQQATEMKRQFGVDARSMEVNLHGLMGPFIFDHYAIEVLLMKAHNKIQSVEEENKTFANDNFNLIIKNADLELKVKNLEERLARITKAIEE